jgi:hypothetical protein
MVVLLFLLDYTLNSLNGSYLVQLIIAIFLWPGQIVLSMTIASPMHLLASNVQFIEQPMHSTVNPVNKVLEKNFDWQGRIVSIKEGLESDWVIVTFMAKCPLFAINMNPFIGSAACQYVIASLSQGHWSMFRMANSKKFG